MHNQARKYAIIAAGGRGTRLGGDLPKQFMLLGSKPVIQYCLEAFYSFDASIKLIIVLPKEHIDTWKELKDKYSINLPHTIVEGGEERFYSIKNAIDLLGPDSGLVAIHDAARPFISQALINSCYEEAAIHGAAIPAVPVKDSLRMQVGERWEHVDRSLYKVIQTPQVFSLHELWQAYRTDYKPTFTDDASVYESSGNKIHLVDGESQNFKITTSDDLAYASFFLKK